MNIRSVDPYTPYERQTRAQPPAYEPQNSFFDGRNPTRNLVRNETFMSEGQRQPTSKMVVSDLEYPSEVNRG